VANPVVLESLAVWLGGYAIEGTLSENHFSLSREMNDDSRFGDTMDCKYPGRLKPMLNQKGFYDVTDGVTSVETLIGVARVFSRSTSWPLTLCPPYAPTAAVGADGNICYTILGGQFSYDIGAKHGESMPYSLVTEPFSQASGGAVARQTIMLPKATYAATTAGTVQQLGLLGSGQVLVAVLHVFAATGGSWVVTIDSDDNSGMATPVTRQTFAAATGITREAIITAGPIATDTYWQATITKTGGTSVVAAVALGIV
jgi:hypothetical protein